MSDTIVCAVCETPNSVEDEICVECGAPLEASADEEFSDEEFSDEEFSDEEFSDEEFSDEEFSDEEFSDQEFSDEEFSDQEFSDQEFSDEEFSDQEFSDEEFSDEEMAAESPDGADEDSEVDIEALDDHPVEPVEAAEELGDAEAGDGEYEESLDGSEGEGEPDFEELAGQQLGDTDTDTEEEVVDPEPTIEAQRSTEPLTRNVSPLPVPGGYSEPARLTIFHDQQLVDTVEIDDSATFIGVGHSKDSAEDSVDSPVEVDVDDEELEVLDVVELEEEIEEISDVEQEAEEVLELGDDAAMEVESDEATAFEDEEVAAGDEWDDETADEEFSSAEKVEAQPASTEFTEGHVDLSAIGDAPLAHRHVAIFKQNRNYTLYVLSDEPTQHNTDLLELGQRKTLSDGDLIVLGGNVALRFDLPAA